jgi:3-oxoacyl-[acyl-carrier protein] reductase
MQLKDRIAIVTGGARGIGRACVQRFLAAGARGVVIADLDGATATEAARALDPSGDRCMPIPADVSVEAQVKSLVDRTADRFGRIDILVNSAGIAGKKGPMESQAEADLDRIWAINMKGTYFTCAAVHPHMIKQGYGRIVNIASIAGKEGNPGLVPYSMTKAAVIGFTKAYSKEVATSGILVNSIAPAVIDTDILKDVAEEVKRYMISKIPMGRVGRTEEVAELVLFLASEAMSFSTGFCFDLSGGRATY